MFRFLPHPLPIAPFVIVLLVLSALGVRSQTLRFAELRFICAEWENYDGLHFQQFTDSVRVSNGNTVLATLKVRAGRITQTLYTEYGDNGKPIRTDSLSTDPDKWHATYYFYTYRGRAVYTRLYHPNGRPESISYYRMDNGRDSLRKSWYPNGVLREKICYDDRGIDTATYAYTPEGTLARTETFGLTREYYPSGIVRSETKTEMLNNNRLTREKQYYPTGILQSVKYFRSDGLPCLTWTFYTPAGAVQKTVKHPPSASPPRLEPVIEVVEMLSEPELFFVDEPADFMSVRGPLAKYLDEKLYTIPTRNLGGIYEVRFTVDTYGQAAYRSVKGQNAGEFENVLRFVINNMPKWKPGKISGRPVLSTLMIRLTISDD